MLAVFAQVGNRCFQEFATIVFNSCQKAVATWTENAADFFRCMGMVDAGFLCVHEFCLTNAAAAMLLHQHRFVRLWCKSVDVPKVGKSLASEPIYVAISAVFCEFGLTWDANVVKPVSTTPADREVFFCLDRLAMRALLLGRRFFGYFRVSQVGLALDFSVTRLTNALEAISVLCDSSRAMKFGEGLAEVTGSAFFPFWFMQRHGVYFNSFRFGLVKNGGL